MTLTCGVTVRCRGGARLNRSQFLLVLAAGLSLHGCTGAGDSPTGTEVEVPVPASTATPPPAPTVNPTPSGLCANGNEPVARFDIKVHSVKNKNGDFREFERFGPFYVGEQLRLDSQGKDRFGRRTDGCSEPRWDWGPDELAMLNADRGWMPVVRVLDEGEFFIDANHDHIKADFPLILKLLSAAAAPQPGAPE